MREDPTFRVHVDKETSETIISGMGELHLEIYVERIKREYKVDCTVGMPKVSYREAPTKVTPYNYKHRKQTGGSGQYAHVVGRWSPCRRTPPSSSSSRTRSPAAESPPSTSPRSRRATATASARAPSPATRSSASR